MARSQSRTSRSPAKSKAKAETSTWHLSKTATELSLSDFEFALLQTAAAFERWAIQVDRLASMGTGPLNFNEIVLLNMVRMHDQPKDAATLARLVNREDVPNVQYNLRKLVSIGLIERVKVGQATFFKTTQLGREHTDAFAELRRSGLLEDMVPIDKNMRQLEGATQLLQLVTGFYDSAARESATLNRHLLFPDD